jgi:hypothetical protein
MKTTRIFKTLILSAAIVVAFTSCDKDENTNDEFVTISNAEETSFVDNVYEEVSSDVDEVLLGEGGEMLKDGEMGGGMGSGCPVVTIEYPDTTARFPKIITMDFGEEGCSISRHNEEMIKRGKIIVTVTDHFMNEGATRTVTFVDFYVNDNLIEGTKLMANNGPNADGFYEFTVQLQNGKITTDEGVEIEREYTRTRTMIAGYDTPRYHWDDEFLIEGSSSGVTSDGTTCSSTITTPLYKVRNCPWFLSGEVTSTIGEDEIIIDFGEGECDNVATKVVNGGEPEEFILEYKYQRRTGIRGNGGQGGGNQ